MRNSLFVAKAYARAISKYIETFALVFEGKYEESWISLQDAASALTTVKRFTEHDVEYLETRIVSFEYLYPYRLFFSIDAIAKSPKCNICGLSYDSPDCIHISGDLYNGVMACKILEEITEVRAVSIVENPLDRRCVVNYGNKANQFKPLQSFVDFVVSNKLPIKAFLGASITDGHLQIVFDEQVFPDSLMRTSLIEGQSRDGKKEDCIISIRED